MRTALAHGAGSRIGGHLVRPLRREEVRVRSADLEPPGHDETAAHGSIAGDLRDPNVCIGVPGRPGDKVCQPAAGVGAAGCSDAIGIWGDGEQARSVLHADGCVAGTMRLLRSGAGVPVGIGSEGMVPTNGFVDLVAGTAGTRAARPHRPGPHRPGPLGVRGRKHLIRSRLGRAPSRSLQEGLERTCAWIGGQVRRSEPALVRRLEPELA